MISKKLSKFYESSIDKQLKLAFSDGTVIDNETIYQESQEISESLCSESTLRFGACEAGSYKIRVAEHHTSLAGQELVVTETVDGDTANPFQVGVYRVVDDIPTADRIYRDITAYDKMYDIINADANDVASWYNSRFSTGKEQYTLKQFRDSFFDFLGIPQESVFLPNDSMIVEKTIDTTSLSGRDVIVAICEVNGCFGHISRSGKFKYIFLPTATATDSDNWLYPSTTLYPGDDVYPIGTSDITIDGEHDITSYYKNGTQYQDYIVQPITRLVIRSDEEDVGYGYGDGSNAYYINSNFLLFGKTSAELESIAKNIMSVISGVSYRPASISAVGNPCLEVGDAITLQTKYGTINTYILQRTLTGIQALSDTFTATGEEQQVDTGNSLESQLIAVKGRTHKLQVDLESFISQLEDLEKGLTSEIEQTIDGISLTIGQKDSDGKVGITISRNGEKITDGSIDLSGVVTFSDLNEENSKTKIIGGNIDTTSLFAQDIKATGTIEGATLTGASGEFTKDFKVSIQDEEGKFRGIDVRNGEFHFFNGNSYLVVSKKSATLSIGAGDLITQNEKYTVIQRANNRIQLVKDKGIFVRGDNIKVYNPITFVHGTAQNVLEIQLGYTIVDDESIKIIVPSGWTKNSNNENTAGYIKYIDLQKGVWAVACEVEFPTNSTGARAANLSEEAGSTAMAVKVGASPSGTTRLAFTKIIKVEETSKRFYLNVFQNSGSELRMQYATINATYISMI